MGEVRVRGMDGDRLLPLEAVDALRSEVTGDVVLPGEPGYEDARTIWNAMIDRHPGLVVRCMNAQDVVSAVRFARDHELLVAVRGGGHNIAGTAVCDDGLLIDLSQMKHVEVDADARIVRVDPGVTLGELDRATQPYNLAVPTGINSTTGIAGLTLGGGFGWLSRKYALTADSLISADIVTADGEHRRIDSHNEPDLFWAIRGGGGNFGVVTSFEFRLHPVGPEVLSGLIVHPFRNVEPLLRFYRDFCASAPDELSAWVVMRKAPPLPFLPPAVHGTEVVVLAACYVGNLDDGRNALAALREYGEPIADVIAPHRFADWQSTFDPLLAPGARNYWKSAYLDLSDGAIEALIRGVEQLPDPQCEIFIAQMAGATTRVPTDATPFTYRSTPFNMNVHARWDDATRDTTCIGWARNVYEAVRPHASEGVYINFLTEEETHRVQPAYGANYTRLVEVKNRYDPINLFRINQNIRPTTVFA